MGESPYLLLLCIHTLTGLRKLDKSWHMFFPEESFGLKKKWNIGVATFLSKLYFFGSNPFPTNSSKLIIEVHNKKRNIRVERIHIWCNSQTAAGGFFHWERRCCDRLLWQLALKSWDIRIYCLPSSFSKSSPSNTVISKEYPSHASIYISYMEK